MTNFYSFCETKAEQIAIVLLAVGGWLSVYPYFLWGNLGAFIVGATMAIAGGGLFLLTGSASKYRGIESWAFIILTVFILYITLQKKMAGGHALWVFVLPTLWALAIFTDDLRKRCILLFASVFVISLIPSMLVWLWVVAGFPVEFNTIPRLNLLMGGELYTLPGVIFDRYNSILLPWGGVLFRLCGMYDEPGMVGTLSALILAAFHFRISDWRSAILFVAGMMSFSLGFMVLVAVGCVARAVILKKLAPLIALIPLIFIASLTLGFITIPTPDTAQSSITFTTEYGANKVEIGRKIRQTALINNRTTLEMELLVNEYWSSDLATIMFGIASDASVVKGGISQVWTRILTNHGIVGFILLFIGCAFYAWSVWQRSGFSPFVMLFFGIFALSFYQRPVIWMPYALVIMICGPLLLAGLQEREQSLVKDRVP